MARDLLELSTQELLEGLSSPDPAPGGGCAAALAIAQAAATLVGAARRSGRVWEQSAGAAAQARALEERAGFLTAEDATAYERAASVLREREGSPGRSATIGVRLGHAADVPLAIAETAADLTLLAADVAAHGDPDSRGDAVSACLIAEGAGHAACHLVAINLVLGERDPRRAVAAALDSSLREIGRQVTR